ncbi:hypothetical protein [Pseudomonas sp. E102]|uniref:hypothetical protein n=1 Tax=Pseudomonas sp. E102 TaxID=181579 RepID=UPI0040467EAD
MSNATEQHAIELRQAGMSIEKIVQKTGLTDYKVKSLTRGIAKVKSINTPFDKSVERVYQLAIRSHGIRDYELRDILHQEYGSTWDSTTGRYVSNYDSNVIKRVREKVRLGAAQEDCNALFVMDWVDEEAPTAGREFLEAAAADLMSRIEICTHQFMELHATRWREDSEEADVAQRKQLYAAKRHLLKLAVKGYGGEPLDMLLERSVALTDALEGTSDAPVLRSHANASGGHRSNANSLKYYPEPSRTDPFLDFVTSQGWLEKVEGRLV